jgi:hypothetical protein
MDGGVFNHDNGTINLTGGGTGFALHSGSLTVNNVNVNFTLAGSGLVVDGHLHILGTFNLNDGILNSGFFEAEGPVNIAAGFDGGGAGLTFVGANSQTFTNLGGANPTGTWTVNKTAGSVLTAASPIILATNQELDITSGNLYLASGSDLTTGPVVISSGGKLVSDTTATITLGANLTNNGAIDLQGGGAACPEADTIHLRSSIFGTRRQWTGTGVFRLVDVDVKDQGNVSGTSPAITVFSGTDLGNNGPNFTFDGNCPTNLSISPQSVSVITTHTQGFTAGGGIGTKVFSIPVNNSGGSINPSTGFYTAGTTADVSDTVRVTDGLGSTADATVNVTGLGTKLAFSVQPSTTAAGQSISPAVQVAIQDANGVTVTSATNSVTLAIANNPSSGTLSGTATQSAVNGVATFNNLSINKVGTGYALRATSSPLTQTTSSAFNINPGAPAKLVFTAQPPFAVAGDVISSVQVGIQDSFGNSVTTATNSITISIGNNPGCPSQCGTLNGTVTKDAQFGAASFLDLSIDRPGNGYTLVASSGLLMPATTNAFNNIDPFVVTNTAAGLNTGSLASAIQRANSGPAGAHITFNIPGPGPFVIQAPNLTVSGSGIVIDGTSQPGYSGSPIIQLVPGASNTDGFIVTGSGKTIKGLSFTGYHTALSLQGSGNVIQGNYVGIDPTGTGGVGNLTGIVVLGSSNLIGGPNSADRNVISGNTLGIEVDNPNNMIRGNYIGTDASGAVAKSNQNGVTLANGANNTVQDNVVSGNTGTGILISAFGDIVKGNLIGLNAAGTSALGNGLDGIQVSAATATDNKLTANRIFGNGKLGIKLGSRVTSAAGPPLPNDPHDPDSGANDLQNYPVLTSAIAQPGNTAISGSLDSALMKTYTLEFFSSPSCNASGNGEGETFLGSSQVSTGSSGIANFTASLPITVANGRFITATATDGNGNTSEFSKCQIANTVHAISGRLTVGGLPIPNVKVLLSGGKTTSTLTDSGGNYSFGKLVDGATYTVTPTSQIYTFNPTSVTVNNLSTDVANQNFVASLVSFTIKGRVLSTFDGSTFPATLSQVSAHCIRPVGNPIDTTNAGITDGNYKLTVPGGNCTVTPMASSPSLVFTPSSVSLPVSSNLTQDFVGQSTTPLTGRISYVNSGVFVLNADLSGQTKVFSGATATEVAFSRDGSRLAATSIVSGQSGRHIAYMNFDGSGQKTIQTGPATANDERPAFFPTGAKVAYVRHDGSSASIRLFDINTNSDALLYQAPASAIVVGYINFSPDGSQMAFMQNDQIFLDHLGTSVTQVTNTGINSEIRWSWDGAKIAFIRRVSGGLGQIFVMNPDGSVQTSIASDEDYERIAWSPDSTKIGFVTGASKFGVMNPDGSGKVIIGSFPTTGSVFSWAPTFAPPTPAGTNVLVTAGATSVTFGGVSTGGTTSVIPIPPGSAGTVPAGFTVGSFGAYEISTTAAVTPPITVCFTVPSTVTQTQFNALNMMHSEGGVLVNRTSSRNFATKQICGSVNSLSPFAIAEEIDPALPSITGLVEDQDGNPMGGVEVKLTGDDDQTTTTDVDGLFVFPNLTDGANYSVQPKQLGMMFSEYSQDLIAVTGENSVVFTGTPANFQLSGHVSDGNGGNAGGVNITLNGAVSDITQTDANGNYSFADLPADGTYVVTASDADADSFDPPQTVIDNLIADTAGADFTLTGPTAAPVSVSGRVIRADGGGIAKARVELIGPGGEKLVALTNPFGYYHFDGVVAGSTYILSVSSKQYRFANNPRVISVLDELAEIDFIGSQ